MREPTDALRDHLLRALDREEAHVGFDKAVDGIPTEKRGARARGPEQLAREVKDLTAKVPTGTGTQTYLRAILLVVDHTAYHVGQIVAVRRALGVWK